MNISTMQTQDTPTRLPQQRRGFAKALFILATAIIAPAFVVVHAADPRVEKDWSFQSAGKDLPIRIIAFATLLLMVYAFVGIPQLAAASASGLTPSRLRCEALVNPLAVDVVPNGLSWIDTSAERSQKQTVWQVLVASSPDRLVEGKADLWDSGKQAGEAMQVPYGGKPLTSLQRAEEQPVDMRHRAEELKNLRWGMWICWSFSTFSGNEWTRGVTDLSFFKATDMDTDEWALTAKEAGMGYILFMTKHHDGFCLWDTKTTDRKVTNAPLGRDVLAELRKSCDKYGIKLALYFSQGEFDENKKYHPGGYTPEMKKAQLKELLTQYGPIEFLWLDRAQATGGVDPEETFAWCKSFQPGCLVGNKEKNADLLIREMGKPGPIPKNSNQLLAEFCYPILPKHEGGAKWFYSLPVHDKLCHSAQKLYSDYVLAVEYGNIFDLGVGPDYNGKLRQVDVDTLLEVGEMIRNQPPKEQSEITKENK